MKNMHMCQDKNVYVSKSKTGSVSKINVQPCHPVTFPKRAELTMHNRRGLQLISTALFLGALSHAFDKLICYTPYLIEDPTSIPCNATAEVSTFCAPYNICLSNGLCTPNVTLSTSITPACARTATGRVRNA